MRTPRVALVVAALWGACGPARSPDPELKASLTTASEAPERDPVSCKPEPPIAVELAIRPLPGDRYELTLSVTAKVDVGVLDAAFVLPADVSIDRARESFGATARGTRRTVVAIAQVPDQRTREISAIVRTPVEGITMSKAATVTVGAPTQAPHTRVYAMPGGELAREVRP